MSEPQDPPADQPPTEALATADDAVQRGSVQFQDADTPVKPPSPAAARRRIMAQEARARKAELEAAAKRKRKRVLIGSGVAVGLVATVAVVYWSHPGSTTRAHCVDASNQPVPTTYCDSGSPAGGFFYFGGAQYHYYYGGSVGPSGSYVGGSTAKPRSGAITTDSGRTIRRGGFGGRISSGKS